jgi:hypothetical protein
MQRAHVLTTSVCLLVASLVSAPATLATSHDLIRPKQEVPNDPLAGLPSDDGRGHGKGGSGTRGKAARAVNANAADDRDIGDLRATLAFVEHGPTSWPCPARLASARIRLRIGIDEAGKITSVEPVSGDSGIASAIAKRLPGKSIAPRAEGATVGIVVVTFASKRAWLAPKPSAQAITPSSSQHDSPLRDL